MDEQDGAFKKAGLDKNQPDIVWAVHQHPEVERAMQLYMQERERFFNGYCCGSACESCERPGIRERGVREAECRHCGGRVTYVGGYRARNRQEESC